MRWSRREFLRALTLGALASSEADARKRRPRKQTPDYEIHGGPLKLPAWRYGDSSSAADTVLMFRGNATHTFYGTGPVSSAPKVRWRFRMEDFPTMLHGKPHVWAGTGWTGQASVLGGYVFVGSVGRNLYCFDADNGTLRWRYRASRMFKSSLCIYQNRLYVGNVDDHLRCFDATTGKVLWRFNTHRDLDSSPVVTGGKLFIAGESGYTRCFDPMTGKLIWQTFCGGVGPGTPGGSNGCETSPAVADGEVYVANYDGVLLALSEKNGKILWKANTGDDTDVSPVISGSRLYIAAEEKNPVLFCFDRSKKGEVVWQHNNRRGWWSTPAVVGERVFIGGHDGRMYCFDAKSGKHVWTYTIGAPTWCSPAVVDDKVIFGCFGKQLHMLNAKNGKPIWRYDIGAKSHSAPCVVNGRIYVGCASGWFYCFS
ncbi:MAG: PQQ-binding-like beta-propeller repeat protein [Myxococcales bacterium]|nr:PQQ-binding-like beta-propeller repeat protein [Myxococcales bacterium]